MDSDDAVDLLEDLAFAHLFGKKGDPEILARLQALADRNIAKYGLLSDEAEPRGVPVPEQGDERQHLI